LKAGGAYAPIDPAYPRQRIDLILEDARPKVIVTESGLAEMFEGQDAEVIRIDSEWDRIELSGKGESESRACPGNIAYVIFTSGSTGRPKGIQVTHRNVVNFLTTMERKLSLTSQDVMLAVTTLSFDIAGLELFLPLLTGGQVVIVGREIAVDGVRLKKELHERQATVMQATPATWQLLIRAGWEGSDSFKALCGGEALTSELANELTARSRHVWNLYGPTETTIWSTAHELKREAGAPPIGRPIANTQIYILDADKQPVPIGVPGELYIGGDGVSRGYFDQPGLTAEKFVPDPFGGHGQRLYRTGDLVRYLPDGGIEFLGRIDHQVKIRGFRIELGDIESALREHEAVREAVVIARTAANGDKLLAGYIVAEGEGVSVSGLKDYLRERLPEYMVPSAIVVMESLPLTPNGKIDRNKLPDPTNHLPEVAFVEPRSEVEKDIARIWQEVLGRDRVGVNDNFFDLGGHSLLLIEAQSKLQAALGRDVLIVELFRYPTVLSLARYLAEGRDHVALSRPAADRAKKRRKAMNGAQQVSRRR
jgi:amino acid adenylation domain-containing protein